MHPIVEALAAGKSVKHKSGKLYRRCAWNLRVSADGLRVEVVGERDGKPFGPIRNVALSTFTLV